MEYAMLIFGIFLCLFCHGWIRYPDDTKDRRQGIFVLAAGILMILLSLATILPNLFS